MNNNKPLFLPGLNGIRAFAAMGVLLSHINLSLKNFGLNNFSLFGFRNEKATYNTPTKLDHYLS